MMTVMAQALPQQARHSLPPGHRTLFPAPERGASAGREHCPVGPSPSVKTNHPDALRPENHAKREHAMCPRDWAQTHTVHAGPDTAETHLPRQWT